MSALALFAAPAISGARHASSSDINIEEPYWRLQSWTSTSGASFRLQSRRHSGLVHVAHAHKMRIVELVIDGYASALRNWHLH